MPQPLLLRLQCVPPFLAQNLKAWQTRLNSELTLKEGREKKLHKLPNQHTYHTCIFCFIGYSLKVLPFPPLSVLFWGCSHKAVLLLTKLPHDSVFISVSKQDLLCAPHWSQIQDPPDFPSQLPGITDVLHHASPQFHSCFVCTWFLCVCVWLCSRGLKAYYVWIWSPENNYSLSVCVLYAHVCRWHVHRPEEAVTSLLYHSHFVRTGFLTELGATVLTSKLSDPPASAPQLCYPYPDFCIGAGDLNSGLYA